MFSHEMLNGSLLDFVAQKMANCSDLAKVHL